MDDRIKKYFDEHEEEMITFWKNVVSIESQSADLEGVGRVAAHLDTYCSALGLETRKYVFDGAGPSLSAKTKKGILKPIVLMAHMDTVHKKGSFGKDVFIREADIVRGPGVYDCKGGIAVAFFVIKALQYAGFEKRQIKLLLVGDEESAHQLSGKESLRLYEEARECAAALNCESGLLNGDVVTARKGGGIVTFQIHGKASHAGIALKEGANAISEAAHKIMAIDALTDYEGTTFNCAVIQGGSGANVVPDYCELKVSYRFLTNEGERIALKQLQEIADRVYVSGTKTEMKCSAGFKAMEKNEKTEPLFQYYQKASEDLGYGRPNMQFSSGCSDGAYVALHGVPVLCSVGVRGEHNHSLDEYALVSSLKERAMILTELIMKLPDDF